MQYVLILYLITTVIPLLLLIVVFIFIAQVIQRVYSYYTDKSKIENIEYFLYNSIFVKAAAFIKIIIQFAIGFAIMAILFLKGEAYLAEFFLDCNFERGIKIIPKCNELPFSELLAKSRNLDVFDFVGKALGVSAGIELAYMLFTDGPDEAISPLIMAVASGAFFSISGIPDGNWVIGVYCVSLVVLLYALKEYDQWQIDKKKLEKDLQDAEISSSRRQNRAFNFFWTGFSCRSDEKEISPLTDQIPPPSE